MPLLGFRVPPRACRLLLQQHLHLQQLQQNLQEHYALTPATTTHLQLHTCTFTPAPAACCCCSNCTCSNCSKTCSNSMHLPLQQHYTLVPALATHLHYTLAPELDVSALSDGIQSSWACHESRNQSLALKMAAFERQARALYTRVGVRFSGPACVTAEE